MLAMPLIRVFVSRHVDKIWRAYGFATLNRVLQGKCGLCLVIETVQTCVSWHFDSELQVHCTTVRSRSSLDNPKYLLADRQQSLKKAAGESEPPLRSASFRDRVHILLVTTASSRLRCRWSWQQKLHCQCKGGKALLRWTR